MKTSCLKCATFLVKDVPAEMEKKLDLTLDVAKKLERYLSTSLGEGETSSYGVSNDPRELEEEF